MEVICAYERKTNRHKWRAYLERPVHMKELVIAHMQSWVAGLDSKWLPRQVGYVIVERPAFGNGYEDLACNAAVTIIEEA